jgi:hypothetical protein
MELERAFTHIWEDEDWLTKVAIAAALTLTGIGGLAVLGWASELSRRVANGEPDTLPTWDRIGDYFIIGLKYFGVTFVWSLPVVLPLVVFAIATTGTTLVMEDPTPMVAVLSILNICLIGFFMLYIVAMSLIIPPLWVLLAEGMPFGEAVRPKNAWGLFKANAGGFLVAMLISWLVASVLGSVGAILCLVGTFFASAISQLVLAHLIGQATAQARANLAVAAQ